MKPELKNQWLAALRGGEIKQARGFLRKGAAKTNKRMCCLGVLCDIIEPNAWERAEGMWLHHGKEYLPAYSRMEPLGLNQRTVDTLAEMNDGDVDNGTTRKSFAQIADYIEENL